MNVKTVVEKILSSDLRKVGRYLPVLVEELGKIEGKENFAVLRLAITESARKLQRDLYLSEHSELKEDWRRVATYELRRLKEMLTELNHMLLSGEVRACEVDPQKFLIELRRKGVITEQTWLLAKNHPQITWGRKEVRETFKKIVSLLEENGGGS